LQDKYGEITARNAEVIAVTTQDLSFAGEAIDTVGIPFPVAYDVTTSVPRQWERFDNFGTELADTAVFVIDSEGCWCGNRWAATTHTRYQRPRS